jgi:hypothetical protein
MKIISTYDFKIIKNHKDGSLDKKRILNHLNIENIKQIIRKVEYKDFVILFFDTKDNTIENVKLLFKTINNFYLVNQCNKNKLRIKVNKFNNTVLLDFLRFYLDNKIRKTNFKIEEIIGNNNYVFITS